jgi:hypothetical protein
MRRFRTILAVAGAAAVAIGVSAGPAAASTLTARTPVHPGVLIPSLTSSGWAAEPILPAETFTRVQDFFKLPKVTCDQNPGGVAAFGVSLGGGSDTDQNTAAKVYVLATCTPHQAKPTYSTGYQLGSVVSGPGFVPKPGDTLDLKVTESGGSYTLSIKDPTAMKVLSGSGLSCSACKNTSAEVTAGSPPGFTPADFGVVHLLGIFVVNDTGVGGGLANAHWNTTKLVYSGPPAPHTVAGMLHTFPGPPPHSGFRDKWV